LQKPASTLSLILGTLIAISIGVPSAVRQGTMIDYAARIFSITGVSIPSFCLAILIILGLVHYLMWLRPLDYVPFWVDPRLNFRQLVCPAPAPGYRLSAVGARMTRSNTLEVLREDYVRTAHAKGVQERVVVLRHALKNALLTIITIIGIELPVSFGGLAVVATVFTQPVSTGSWWMRLRIAITHRSRR
jgi:peptide/nickel transport system permease protein